MSRVFPQQGFGLGKKPFEQGALLLQQFPYPDGRGCGDGAPFVGVQVHDHFSSVLQGIDGVQQCLLHGLEIRLNPMGCQQQLTEVALNHHALAPRHVHHHHVKLVRSHRAMGKGQDGTQRQDEDDHHGEQALPDGQRKRIPRFGRCIHHSQPSYGPLMVEERLAVRNCHVRKR